MMAAIPCHEPMSAMTVGGTCLNIQPSPLTGKETDKPRDKEIDKETDKEKDKRLDSQRRSLWRDQNGQQKGQWSLKRTRAPLRNQWTQRCIKCPGRDVKDLTMKLLVFPSAMASTEQRTSAPRELVILKLLSSYLQ